MTIFCNYVENIARSNYYMTLKINNINKTDGESYKLSFKDSKFENIYERLLNNKSFIIFVYKMFSFCYKHLAGYFIFFNAQDVKVRLLEYFFGNLKLCWVRTLLIYKHFWKIWTTSGRASYLMSLKCLNIAYLSSEDNGWTLHVACCFV